MYTSWLDPNLIDCCKVIYKKKPVIENPYNSDEENKKKNDKLKKKMNKKLYSYQIITLL